MSEKTFKYSQDFLFTFLSKIIYLALGVMATVIIARALGAQGNGVYTIAILLPSFLVTFGKIGVTSASIYYLAKKKYTARIVFGNNITILMIFSVMACFTGAGIILIFQKILFPNIASFYLYLGLFLIPFETFFLCVSTFFLGVQEVKKYNLQNIAHFGFFVVLLLVMLLGRISGVAFFILATIFSYVFVLCLIYVTNRDLFHSSQYKIDFSYLKDVLGYGYKIYFGNIIQAVHYRVDIFIVNILLNPFFSGIYAIASLSAEKMGYVADSAGLILFPKISSEQDLDKVNAFTPAVCRNILFFMLIVSIIAFGLYPIFIRFFFPEEFSASVAPFRVLLLSAVSIGGWRVLANDLYGRGLAGLNIVINFTSCSLNILLNIFLIPRYGIVGAAWASSITYTLSFLVLLRVYISLSGNCLSDIVLIKKTDFVRYKDFICHMFRSRVHCF